LKDIRKNKVYGEKDQDAVVDKVAGTSLMGNSLSDVKQAIQHESLDLSATGDTTTSNASQEDETVELDEAKLSTAQLNTLKQKYSGLRGSEKNGIQMDKLAKIMKRYPKPMLDQLAGLDIPMVSKVAKAMTEETMTEAWQYEMEIEYGDSMDDDSETIIVFGNVRGATLESQADRKYDQLEKQMQKKYGRDAMIDGGTMRGKTNTQSRGGSNPLQRKDI
jgi:DNA-binding transcriptional MerR regulator